MFGTVGVGFRGVLFVGAAESMDRNSLRSGKNENVPSISIKKTHFRSLDKKICSVKKKKSSPFFTALRAVPVCI